MLAWHRGEPAAAIGRLEEALAVAREHDVRWLQPSILVGLGSAWLDRGNPARAAAFVHESLELGLIRGNLGDVIEAVEVLGRLGAADGQAEPAARLFGAAAALREEIGTPPNSTESAQLGPVLDGLRRDLGAARFAAATEAGRALSREEAIAQALALRPVPTEMSPSGRSRPSTHPHGLTAREREVLRLLAAGASSPEIGERLFISQTTAERHVANIYRKLGVDSRARAITVAHRLGLV
jgi:DNA-binding CsgD family transcriptional regulator